MSFLDSDVIIARLSWSAPKWVDNDTWYHVQVVEESWSILTHIFDPDSLLQVYDTQGTFESVYLLRGSNYHIEVWASDGRFGFPSKIFAIDVKSP